MATTAETTTAALAGIESALRSVMEPESESEAECDMCERSIRTGLCVSIGSMTYHQDCGVLVAASIASSVMTGGDEIAKEVSQAAEILEMAVRVMRSRLGGRAA